MKNLNENLNEKKSFVYFSNQNYIMAKVGVIGAGTLSVIILVIVLIILLILYLCKVPAMKFVFWIYFVLLVITIIVLFTLPLENERLESDEDGSYNHQFPKVLAFGICIVIGLVVSIVLYFYAVLLHENSALVVPNYS